MNRVQEIALRKLFLAQRMTRAERKAIRRFLLPDGSVLIPQPGDREPMPGIRLMDPRTSA